MKTSKETKHKETIWKKETLLLYAVPVFVRVDFCFSLPGHPGLFFKILLYLPDFYFIKIFSMLVCGLYLKSLR